MLGSGAWLAAAAAAAVLAAAATVASLRSPPYGSNYSVRYGKIPATYKAEADCVGNRRLQMRPYPGDCYGHDFEVSETDAWWNLFSEIGGDLQYTFDFILHDPIVQSAEVNQLWYLLAYLQRLARLVPDPADVQAAPAARRALSAGRRALSAGRRALSAGRRAGSQRAARLAARLQAELSVLDALIVQAEAARRRRHGLLPAAAAASPK